MPALVRVWEDFHLTELSQILFVLSKWGARVPAPQLRAAAAALREGAGQLDGPAVCSLAATLTR
jgi:hypothetical protein